MGQDKQLCLFTHDLDFGTLLAVTQAEAPSVLQVRVQDTFISALGETVLSALQQFQKELAAGALVTVDSNQKRVRILPLKQS